MGRQKVKRVAGKIGEICQKQARTYKQDRQKVQGT